MNLCPSDSIINEFLTPLDKDIDEICRRKQFILPKTDTVGHSVKRKLNTSFNIEYDENTINDIDDSLIKVLHKKKSKYDEEWKQQIIEYYDNNNIKPSELAKKYKVPPSTLRDWISKYSVHRKKANLNPSILATQSQCSNFSTSTPEPYTQNLIRNCSMVTPPSEISQIMGDMDSEVIFNDGNTRIADGNLDAEKSTLNISVDDHYELLEQ